jgi:hypothetical protein
MPSIHGKPVLARLQSAFVHSIFLLSRTKSERQAGQTIRSATDVAGVWFSLDVVPALIEKFSDRTKIV